MSQNQPLEQDIQLRSLLSIDTQHARSASALLNHSLADISARNGKYNSSSERLLATRISRSNSRSRSFDHRELQSQPSIDVDLEASLVLVPLDSPTGQIERDATDSLLSETKNSWHSKSNKTSIHSILRELSSCLYRTSCRVIDISDNEDVLQTHEASNPSCTNSLNAAISTFETPSLSSPLFPSCRHSHYAPIPDRRFLVRAVRRILYNVWTQPFMLFLVLLQMVVLIWDTIGYRTPYGIHLFSFGGSWNDSFYPIIIFLNTVELVCKGALHWFGRENATAIESRLNLRNFFNALDFVAVVSYWINFIMMLADARGSRFRQILATLSALRILRLLRITAGTESETTVIFEALKESGAKLGKVASFICFFWLLFAVVGVQTFKSSLKRSCVLPNTGSIDMKTAFGGQIQFCGGYLANDSGLSVPHSWLKRDGSPGAVDYKGYICPRGMVCQESFNPHNGTVSFDNIFQSLELVFVTFSANTFSALMYNVMDSDGLAAALFFAAVIIVLYFWLVILLIGVITGAIQDIRQKLRVPAVVEDGQSVKDSLRLKVRPKQRTSTSLQKTFRKTKWFWIIAIVYSLATQALRASWMSVAREAFINHSESVVTWILLSEIVLRFTLEWRTFHQSKQNLMDVGLAIITSIMQIPLFQRAGRTYTWFTVFRIARSYRIFWAIRPVRDLMVSEHVSLILQPLNDPIDDVISLLPSSVTACWFPLSSGLNGICAGSTIVQSHFYGRGDA